MDDESMAVQVVVRMRPLLGDELDKGSKNVLHVDPRMPECISVSNTNKRFTYDDVVPSHAEDSQNKLYSVSVQPLVEWTLSGRNATVLAYGQTGSGKTYTMMGGAEASVEMADEHEQRQWGVIPRIANDLFEQIERMQSEAAGANSKIEITVEASFLEIYNEEIRDLLISSKRSTSTANSRTDRHGSKDAGQQQQDFTASTETVSNKRFKPSNGEPSSVMTPTATTTTRNARHSLTSNSDQSSTNPLKRMRSNDNSSTEAPVILQLREDVQGNVVVTNLTNISVNSLSDVLAHLKKGNASRAVGKTNMNAGSSRSHAVFTLKITVKDASSVCTSCLRLVDLAGSERAKRTNAQGQRFTEGVNINKGLLALGNVISALGDPAKRSAKAHVPYRDSKLTRMLQSSLGGNSRTVMVACVSPSDADVDETTNTLKYAARARNIKNQTSVAKVTFDSSEQLLELQGIVRKQKEQMVEQQQQLDEYMHVIKKLKKAEKKQKKKAAKAALQEAAVENSRANSSGSTSQPAISGNNDGLGSENIQRALMLIDHARAHLPTQDGQAEDKNNNNTIEDVSVLYELLQGISQELNSSLKDKIKRTPETELHVSMDVDDASDDVDSNRDNTSTESVPRVGQEEEKDDDDDDDDEGDDLLLLGLNIQHGHTNDEGDDELEDGGHEQNVHEQSNEKDKDLDEEEEREEEEEDDDDDEEEEEELDPTERLHIERRQDLIQQLTSIDDQMTDLCAKPEQRKRVSELEELLREAESESIKLKRRLRDLSRMAKRSKVGSGGVAMAETRVAAAEEKERQKTSEQLGKITDRLKDLKGKYTEQCKVLKLQARALQKSNTLQEQVVALKQVKVALVRRIRQENREFLKWKKEQGVKLKQLTRKSDKQEHQHKKLENKYEKQNQVLKRRTEQVSAVQKRLKEAVFKQQSARHMRLRSANARGKHSQQQQQHVALPDDAVTENEVVSSRVQSSAEIVSVASLVPVWESDLSTWVEDQADVACGMKQAQRMLRAELNKKTTLLLRLRTAKRRRGRLQGREGEEQGTSLVQSIEEQIKSSDASIASLRETLVAVNSTSSATQSTETDAPKQSTPEDGVVGMCASVGESVGTVEQGRLLSTKLFESLVEARNTVQRLKEDAEVKRADVGQVVAELRADLIKERERSGMLEENARREKQEALEAQQALILKEKQQAQKEMEEQQTLEEYQALVVQQEQQALLKARQKHASKQEQEEANGHDENDNVSFNVVNVDDVDDMDGEKKNKNKMDSQNQEINVTGDASDTDEDMPNVVDSNKVGDSLSKHEANKNDEEIEDDDGDKDDDDVRADPTWTGEKTPAKPKGRPRRRVSGESTRSSIGGAVEGATVVPLSVDVDVMLESLQPEVMDRVNRMNKAALQDALAMYGLNVSGRKNELHSRLMEKLMEVHELKYSKGNSSVGETLEEEGSEGGLLVCVLPKVIPPRVRSELKVNHAKSSSSSSSLLASSSSSFSAKQGLSSSNVAVEVGELEPSMVEDILRNVVESGEEDDGNTEGFKDAMKRIGTPLKKGGGEVGKRRLYRKENEPVLVGGVHTVTKKKKKKKSKKSKKHKKEKQNEGDMSDDGGDMPRKALGLLSNKDT